MIEGLSSVSLMQLNIDQPVLSAKKMSIPVRPLLSPSLVFKHVMGVPARNEAEAVPTFKLSLVNALIDQITRLDKHYPLSQLGKTESPDGTIELVNRLHADLRQAEAARGRFGSGLAPESGLALNLFA